MERCTIDGSALRFVEEVFLRPFKLRLTYANAMSTIAVFIALGGTSYAAVVVTGSNVRDESLTGRDVRNGSLGLLDIESRARAALRGQAGPAGANGRDGQTGPVGGQGFAGAAGATGPSGLTGATGAAGPSGDRGADGAPGIIWRGEWQMFTFYAVNDVVTLGGSSYRASTMGANRLPPNAAYWDLLASRGSVGMTGAAGPDGPAGAQGAAGPQGAVGLKGDTGAAGPQGLKGDAGAAGPQGLKGDTGAAGPQGLKGDTGAAGPQGPAGPSEAFSVSSPQSVVISPSQNPDLATLTVPAGSYVVSAKLVLSQLPPSLLMGAICTLTERTPNSGATLDTSEVRLPVSDGTGTYVGVPLQGVSTTAVEITFVVRCGFTYGAAASNVKLTAQKVGSVS